MQFLHTSDLHLCDQATSDGAQRLRVLEEICGKAKDCDALVIAGDVFHDATEGENRALRDAVSKLLASVGKPVLIIAGNHDILRATNGNPLDGQNSFGDNVKLFTATPFDQFDLGKVRFYGVPFQPGAAAADLLRSLPPADDFHRVGIIHGTAVDRKSLAMYAQDPESREEGDDLLIHDKDLIDAKFRYTALGHIHKAESWSHPDGSKAAYSGSPDMVTVKEEGIRNVNIVTLDENTGAVSLTPEELTSAVRSKRKTFFALPGREKKVFEEIKAFVAAEGAQVRPTAYIRGLGSKRLLNEGKASLEQTFLSRKPAPTIKLRATELGDDTLEETGLVKAFLDKMEIRAQEAKTETEQITIARATLLGHLALTGNHKGLDNLRDTAATEDAG